MTENDANYCIDCTKGCNILMAAVKTVPQKVDMALQEVDKAPQEVDMALQEVDTTLQEADKAPWEVNMASRQPCGRQTQCRLLLD